MANPQHLEILLQAISQQNPQIWSKWRSELGYTIRPDLSEAKISNCQLSYIDFTSTDLRGCDLKNAVLIGAKMLDADLTGASLVGANLGFAQIAATNLSSANLTDAILDSAFIWHSELDGTNFTNAILFSAQILDTDLSRAVGLESVKGGKVGTEISISTIYESKGNIPDQFLMTAHVPLDFIKMMRSLDFDHYAKVKDLGW